MSPGQNIVRAIGAKLDSQQSQLLVVLFMKSGYSTPAHVAGSGFRMAELSWPESKTFYIGRFDPASCASQQCEFDQQ
ncbi:MAG: hypothetical protein ACRD82_13510 [Blastocatellia bacterium]